MIFTASQLMAHAIGDYVLQSHWMANEKTKKTEAAFIHSVFYTLPFTFITFNFVALMIIAVTHYFIDRYRLARWIVWWKNYIAPSQHWPRVKKDEKGKIIYDPPYSEHDEGDYKALAFIHPTPTGFPLGTPDWLAVWLLIIVDNILHVVINALAIHWFG